MIEAQTSLPGHPRELTLRGRERIGDGVLVGAVQAVGEILELGREQVTIPVEAHLNTGVAQVLTDRLRAGTANGSGLSRLSP